MNKQEALKEVEYIKTMVGDNETAHSAEDDLRERFISDVAKRKDSLGEVAKIILSTSNLDFARWCA